MATNYRRVNLDGKMDAETRLMADALQPGTIVVINSDGQFEAATDLSAPIYVLDRANHQGLGITDAVPAGDSGCAYYAQEGREFAVRVGAGDYTKDQLMGMDATGNIVAATDTAIALCQDTLNVAAGETDFIRVRIIERIEVGTDDGETDE